MDTVWWILTFLSFAWASIHVHASACQPDMVDFQQGYVCVITRESDFQDIPEDATDLDLKFAAHHTVPVSSGLIPPQGDLHFLKVDVTHLPEIPAGAFSQLRDLQRLSLYHVLPAGQPLHLALHPRAFAGLASLTDLHLVDLSLDTLPQGVFDDLTHLQILDINKNQLRGVPKGVLSGLQALSALSLARNQIQDLQDVSLDALDSLTSLNLYSNHITRLSAASLGPLPSLVQLNLEHNQIATIEEGALAGLPHLEKLYLEDNNLTNLQPGAFQGLNHLSSLRLSRNAMEALDQAPFSSLPSLQHLYLKANHFRYIEPSVLANLPQLRTLNLAHNKLESFYPQLLANCRDTLEELDLSYNQLETLDEGLLEGLPNLRYLFLQGNQLAWLPTSLPPLIQELDLSGNAWICDCTLYWLQHWLREHLTLQFYEEPICATPPVLRGQPLTQAFARNPLGCTTTHAPTTTTPTTTTAQTTEASTTRASTTAKSFSTSTTTVTTFLEETTSTPSNETWFSGHEGGEGETPPKTLSAGAKAGIVAGLVILALILLVVTTLTVYMRHKRRALWTPSKDAEAPDREARFYWPRHRAPSGLFAEDVSSCNNNQPKCTGKEGEEPNSMLGLDMHMELECPAKEPRPRELKWAEIRDSGLGNSMPEINPVHCGGDRRPSLESLQSSRAEDTDNDGCTVQDPESETGDTQLPQEGHSTKSPPDPVVKGSVLSLNSYEGAVFNESTQHYPSTLDLVYM